MTVEPVDLPRPNETLQQTAQRMTVAFNKLCDEFSANTEELKLQKTYSRHTRFGVWVAIASLLVDLPLTALLLLSYNDSNNAVKIANEAATTSAEAAKTSAHTAQEDLYTNCLKGNATRQEEASLFNDILVSVSPLIGPVEATKFSKVIIKTFALRDCNKLKPKAMASAATLHLGSLGPWSTLTSTSSVETMARISLPLAKGSCRLPDVPGAMWTRITQSPKA